MVTLPGTSSSANSNGSAVDLEIDGGPVAVSRPAKAGCRGTNA
jgi:hypothetical protein